MKKWGNRTRIIATIGPASGSVTKLSRMITAGMNVARLNFSHGTHTDHGLLIKNIRSAEKKCDKVVGILQDLQGPKIRIGALEKAVKVSIGERVVFKCGLDSQQKNDEIPISFAKLASALRKGDKIFVDDGMLEFVVESKRGSRIYAEVVEGGEIGSNKGINTPDTDIVGDPFTDKDLQDLHFGIKNGVDMVALSFVDDPTFVKKMKKMVGDLAKKYKQNEPKLLIKIERKGAVDKFINFLPYIDGVMIARGDLGVELPYEQIPLIQKDIIDICRVAGKPVIVATHMLESMKLNSRATRAEVSDVANAVIDGADAVMLSAETATGRHPYTAVMTMSKVIEETEKSFLDDLSPFNSYVKDQSLQIAGFISNLAESNLIDAVVTAGDFSVFDKLAVYRPEVPILTACTNQDQARRIILRSGVLPFILNSNSGSFIHRAEVKLKGKYISSNSKILFIVEDTKKGVQLYLR